jgi:hypothetical protein
MTLASLAAARAIVLLTVPTAQSSTWATCASDRSSKTRSTSTARCRPVNDPSALRTAIRTATSAATSPGAGLSGTASDARSRRHRRRLQVAQVFTMTRRTLISGSSRRLDQILRQRPVTGQQPRRPLQRALARHDELRESFDLGVHGTSGQPDAATCMTT